MAGPPSPGKFRFGDCGSTPEIQAHVPSGLSSTGRSLYSKNAVKHFVGICVLALVGSSCVLGQTASVPTKWIGTWTLNIQKSTFGAILMPGVPVGLTIVSQR